MNFISAQDVFFDDKATLAMGAAFDEACGSLRRFARYKKVRELIAKRIIEAAKTGELDPIRLHSQAILEFSIDNVSMPSVSVDRNPPDSGLCIDRVHSVIIESPAGTPLSAGLSSFFLAVTCRGFCLCPFM